MKLSTRGRYSSRMMLEFGLRYGQGPTLLKNISNSQEISLKYLSQLIIPLKVAGLLNGTRGAHGGYLLARPPKDIKLSDIVSAVEGSLSLVECVDNPEICHRYSTCVTQEIWNEISRKCHEILESYTLQDMIDRQLKKQKRKAS